MERQLKDLSVEGVKTRKTPNKHIVFAVQVTWSDGQVNVVSRRYSEFFELMERLNETFPVEAGKHENNQRILPNLHAKKTFLLNSSVMKQLERITNFTKGLVRLPDHISQCYEVRNFFTPTEVDIECNRRLSIAKPKTKPRNWRRKITAKKVLNISGPLSLEQYRVIADVEECKTGGLELKEGQIVEVVEKLENGWWLVTADGEQGWVPASYLVNEDNSEETLTIIKYQPGQGECYVTNKSYIAKFKDELSFDIGVHLQVIEKNLDGWWRAIYNGCEGLVPAAYLKKIGKNTSKNGNKHPPIRKVLSQRYSVSSHQNDMTVETIAKLRESAFKSPEEKEEQKLFPKRKLARAEAGNIYIELKTSKDGGLVPQVIPATQTPENERKISHDKEKGFLKGFGESDDNKPVQKKKNLLKLNLPRRSKSAASDLNSLKRPIPKIEERNEKVLKPVDVKQTSRRKSMVEEMMPHNGTEKKNEIPSQQSQSLESGRKYRQKWSLTEENNFHALPWKNEDEKNEYIRSLRGDSSPSKRKTRSLSELRNSEFSSDNSIPITPMKQEMKKLDGPQIHVEQKVDDNQTKQNTCTSCKDAPVSDSPMFVVTPPTPKAIKKSRQISELDSYASKNRLHWKKSHSFSDLASLNKRLEDDGFVDNEDNDDFYLDEDDDSSDEEICTLVDLLNEDSESKGIDFYYEDLTDNTQKMSRESGSFDSGMEVSSPPPSPMTIKIPYKSAASKMYVAIADYQGSKRDGEVDLFEGQQVRVLHKTVGGWWLVENDAKQRGWAPSNFLEHFKPPM